MIITPSPNPSAPDCPICGKRMSPTANSNLFLCKLKRSIFIEELGDSVQYYDCALEVDPERGGYCFQQYDLPPYQITIYSKAMYPTQNGTLVKKIIKLHYDMHIEDMEPFKVWKEVFHTLEELDLPWHDHNKCVEKIKKLVIFS